MDRFNPPSRRRTAFMQLAIGYAGIAISIVQGILMVPMYLHFIGPRMYGLWLASGGIISWLGVLDLGIAGLMGQRIAVAFGKRDEISIGRYYLTGLMFQSVLVSILFFGGLIFALVMPGILHAGPSERLSLKLAIIIGSLSTALTWVNNGQHNTAAALHRPTFTISVTVLSNVVSIMATVALLFKGHGVVSIPTGMLVGIATALSVNLIYVNTIIRSIGAFPALSVEVWRDFLCLSPALLFAKTGSALLDRIEPTLVAVMIGPEAAVTYTLTNRAAEVVQMAVDRITGSVTAGFAHLYSQGDYERVAKIFKEVVKICLMITVVGLTAYLMLNRSFVRLWIGSDHFGGQRLSVLLSLAMTGLVFNNLFTMLLGASGDIAVPCVVIFGEAIIRLVLMAVFLRYLGLIGLPIVTVLTAGGVAVWLGYRASRRFQVKSAAGFKIGSVASWALLILAAIFSGMLHPTNWSNFGCDLAVIVAISTIFVTIGDPDIIYALIRKVLRR